MSNLDCKEDFPLNGENIIFILKDSETVVRTGYTSYLGNVEGSNNNLSVIIPTDYLISKRFYLYSDIKSWHYC